MYHAACLARSVRGQNAVLETRCVRMQALPSLHPHIQVLVDGLQEDGDLCASKRVSEEKQFV